MFAFVNALEVDLNFSALEIFICFSLEAFAVISVTRTGLLFHFSKQIMSQKIYFNDKVQTDGQDGLGRFHV